MELVKICGFSDIPVPDTQSEVKIFRKLLELH